eukprot:TRINITY_DN68724_c0_g1_i1.p1 TRINITY_DN68724_c0_g1~~TRINITY_DN68724_c0_g1_i1.p1  ORF type:complete len:442 (+),score=60.61 TRINITY_DN68724_c0_g1_i1:55-1380(+)
MSQADVAADAGATVVGSCSNASAGLCDAVEVHDVHVAVNVDDVQIPISSRWQQQVVLLTISLGIFSVLSIWFVASAVVAPLKEVWHISDAHASFLTSMVNVGFVVGCMINAILNTADLVYPQRLIVIGSVGAALANAALLLDVGFFGALITRFLVGASLSLVYPPSVKLLAAWFEPEHRAYAMGVMFTFFSLGGAFPQLMVFVGVARSWKVIVLATSGVAVGSGALVALFVPSGPFVFPAGSFDVGQFRHIFSNASIALPILAYCCHLWEVVCVWAWIGTFLERIWNMNPTRVPLLAFTVIAAGGAGTVLGGILGDRIGRAQTSTVALASSATCLVLLALLGEEGPFSIRVCVFLLWGVTAMIDSPNFSALVSANSDPRYIGTAVTVQLMCGYLVAVLALWLVPAIAFYISWRWSFALLAVGPLVGVFALAILQGRTYKEK